MENVAYLCMYVFILSRAYTLSIASTVSTSQMARCIRLQSADVIKAEEIVLMFYSSLSAMLKKLKRLLNLFGKSSCLKIKCSARYIDENGVHNILCTYVCKYYPFFIFPHRKASKWCMHLYVWREYEPVTSN